MKESMTVALPYICGHCESRDNPVTLDNGLSVSYEAANNVHIEIHLHHRCAGMWSQLFHIPLPNGPVSVAENNTQKRALRILVADDHPTIMQMVEQILEAHSGFEVVGEARDGQHAVTLAEALKPDVVVINITMPKMSGFEAAKRIRLCLPDCAIVILSSHKDKQFIAEARKAGANGYVAKSDADRELVHAIESAVKGEQCLIVD
jgi:CheY-like chemotaxis protein